MTLAFSTHLNKIPTNFVYKILTGQFINNLLPEYDFEKFKEIYCTDYINGGCICENTFNPKIHTIRTDNSNRWKAGNLIHFVINNRTPNRYQFAPVLKCVSVQKFLVHYGWNPKTKSFKNPTILVDGKMIIGKKLLLLAQNDGFDSVAAFLNYFDKDFKGTIIHWTDKKY